MIGISFAKDIAESVAAPDNTTWGTFAGGLNVVRATSKTAAYATAWQAANRRRTTVQIYAVIGRGWTQVDVVQPTGTELCEWSPGTQMRATGDQAQDCLAPAQLSVGRRENWHLCGACADLPKFRRMNRLGQL
ncbi:hypothetical protein [Catenuloplanes japonicus]|uniref:hypothetical protein n=1 Tax=Catenuloplanes japonicus TaxID=33876 RepID=UPI00052570C1|nr:hypothetical protein [Catenuloplanes japonicus]